MPLEDDPGLAAGWLLCSFVFGVLYGLKLRM